VSPTRHTTAALVAVCLGYFMIILDATIVNAALPALRADLRVGPTGPRWVVDGYLVMLAGLLLSGGALADRFGARRVGQLGLGVFVVASVGCGLAPDLATLVLARLVQGVGAAAAACTVAGQSLDNSVIAYFPGKTEAETNIRAIIGRWEQVPGNSYLVPCSLPRFAKVFRVEAIGRRSSGAILGGRFFGSGQPAGANEFLSQAPRYAPAAANASANRRAKRRSQASFGT